MLPWGLRPRYMRKPIAQTGTQKLSSRPQGNVVQTIYVDPVGQLPPEALSLKKASEPRFNLRTAEKGTVDEAPGEPHPRPTKSRTRCPSLVLAWLGGLFGAVFSATAARLAADILDMLGLVDRMSYPPSVGSVWFSSGKPPRI